MKNKERKERFGIILNKAKGMMELSLTLGTMLVAVAWVSSIFIWDKLSVLTLEVSNVLDFSIGLVILFPFLYLVLSLVKLTGDKIYKRGEKVIKNSKDNVLAGLMSFGVFVAIWLMVRLSLYIFNYLAEQNIDWVTIDWVTIVIWAFAIIVGVSLVAMVWYSVNTDFALEKETDKESVSDKSLVSNNK